MKGSIENPRHRTQPITHEQQSSIVTHEYLLTLLDDPYTTGEAVILAHRIGLLDGTYRRGTNPAQLVDELRSRIHAQMKTERE